MNVPFFGLIVLRVQIFEASTVKAMQPARLATHYPSELSESKLHTSKKMMEKKNAKRESKLQKKECFLQTFFSFFLRKVFFPVFSSNGLAASLLSTSHTR